MIIIFKSCSTKLSISFFLVYYLFLFFFIIEKNNQKIWRKTCFFYFTYFFRLNVMWKFLTIFNQGKNFPEWLWNRLLSAAFLSHTEKSCFVSYYNNIKTSFVRPWLRHLGTYKTGFNLTFFNPRKAVYNTMR